MILDSFHMPANRTAIITMAVFCLLLLLPSHTSAAPLTDISYRLTSPLTGAFSDSLLMFRSATGVSGGTITINLSSIASSLSSVSIADLSLMYRGTKATLANAAGAGVWGASISTSSNTLTFTYPVTGGTPISAGSMVVVSTNGGGLRRPVNASSAGAKNVAIVAQGDSGTATATLVETPPANTLMINATSSNGLRVGVSAGTNTGEVGVSLIAEDSFGVGANRLDQVVTYGIGGILAPSDMVGTASSEGRIEIGWRDNTDIGLGYIVERKEIKEVDTAWEPIAILDRDSTRYTDTNLKSQTQYQYRLRAFNSVNFSSYLTSGVIQTPAIAVPFAPFAGFIPGLSKRVPSSAPSSAGEPSAGQPAGEPTVKPIANVGNLTGLPGNGTAQLRWENPSDPDFLFVQIQWSDSGFSQSPSEGVTVFKEGGVAFSDQNLPNGQPSYYTVFAVSKYGIYSSGSFIAVTPSGPPPAPPEQPNALVPPESASTVSTTTQASPPPSAEASAQASGVTLTLQPSVQESFAASANGAVQITNPDSLGGNQTLAVAVPPAAVNARYQLSVASYSLDQAQEIDASISIPAGSSIASQTVYRVTIEKAAVEVRKLEKPITLEFRYATTSLGDVDEMTLHARYWDPLASQWLDVPSKVDTERKVVMATATHLSLFSLFGEKKKSETPSLLKIITREKIDKPELPSFKPDALFDLSQFVTVSGRELVATAGSETAFCITQEMFPRPVRFMTVTVDASKYFLVYDFARRCYAGTILMPAAVGSHALQIKVVFADDFSQTGDFTLTTTEKKPLLSLPAPVQSAVQHTQTPLAFFLIVLVAVFVMYGAIVHGAIKRWRKK